MAKKIKYGKIAIVIFLTALIWIWADLRKTEEFPVSGAKIAVAASTNQNLLISFGDESSVSIEKIVLKGSTAKIDDLKKKLREGKPVLSFVVDTEELVTMTNSGEYPLNVLNLLKQSEQISQLGLTAISCEPKTLSVQILTLAEKSLPVRCFDEYGIPLEAESIEPPNVNAFVPTDQTLVAKVQLTRREIDQARVSAIEKTPYVELPGGQIRNVAATVKIKLPPAEDELQDYTIITATLGFCLTENLQGQYKVELINPTDMSMVRIMATFAAKQAYEEQPYQMILYIEDDDSLTTEEQRRPVVFNFPEEYVREGEIRLNQDAKPARFKLIALTPSESGTEE